MPKSSYEFIIPKSLRGTPEALIYIIIDPDGRKLGPGLKPCRNCKDRAAEMSGYCLLCERLSRYACLKRGSYRPKEERASE